LPCCRSRRQGRIYAGVRDLAKPFADVTALVAARDLKFDLHTSLRSPRSAM
jgi:hypothetical protein